MKCLLYHTEHHIKWENLASQLLHEKFPFERTNSMLTAIKLLQEQDIRILVMDSHISHMKIEDAIRIFKYLIPDLRILVSTGHNTRTLEARVRKEQIYYYHIDMSGMNELVLAISSAFDNVSRQGDDQHITMQNEHWSLPSARKVATGSISQTFTHDSRSGN